MFHLRFLAHTLRCFCLGSFISATLLAASSKSPPPPYRGAIVMDAATGAILSEDKADAVSPPASVTKLMTYLLVHDEIQAGNLSLDTPVTVTKDAAAVGGSQVWLAEGEVFPVEDLLFALMIQSANDAAHALARVCHGSREQFVAKMNERALTLGMTKTVFRTPHGLPATSRRVQDGDVTTARDLALLSRELLLHTDILRFTSVKERVFRPGQPAPKEVIMRSHNHLVGKVKGVDGLKTGFTASAGYCLAATAERDRQRVIVVLLGGPDHKTRDIKVAELLERGFALMPTNSTFVPAPRSPFVTAPASRAAASRPPADLPPATSPAKKDAPPTVKFVPPRS